MIKYTIFLFLTLLSLFGDAQVTVNSLAELKPYLDDNNVNVKLAPGTYKVTADDFKNDVYDSQVSILGDVDDVLFLFEGNDNTYDFTGVTIEVETAVFNEVRNDLHEVQIIGNNNVLKNLTMVDDGSVYDKPRTRVRNVVMDGEYNRLEGFHISSKGSSPYGYGDAFGKGGGPVISHNKHSTLLVRGNYNHVKNCTMIHRTYGHCIFMQAADHATIEGCYVEGEVRSTDDMLAEEGTGSAADKVGFMTTWGYKLPAGYMMSTGEAGIRAYNAGATIVNGVGYEAGTSNPTVINCTIKHMRTGVTLAHAKGTKYVEGCTAIGCENGFSLGSGTLLNCSADCAYGPVYANTYQNDKNFHAEITILAAIDPYYNGSKSVAYFGGSNHNVTFNGTESVVNQDLKIKLGGAKGVVRLLGTNSPTQNNLTANNMTLENHSAYPMVIVTGSDDNDIQTCGMVTDNGSRNDITPFENCEIEPTCGGFDALSTIEGEAFCETKGASIASGGIAIGSLFDGDWVKYNRVDFGDSGVNGIEMILGKKHEGMTSVDIYLDALNGELVGTIDVPNTGGWSIWETVVYKIASVTGIHDVYLSFNNPDPATGVTNVESFKFVTDVSCLLSHDAFTIIEAEDFCEMSGVQAEASSENGENIGYINNGDFIKYSNIDFGTQTANSIDVRVSSKFDGGQIEIRTDSETGKLIGSLGVDNTGGNQAWETRSVNIENMSGVHDIYLVFRGDGDGYLFNVNYFEFKESIVTGTNGDTDNGINIYPNPTNSELFISDAQGSIIELYNNTGELMLSNKVVDANHHIDMTIHVAGMYFIKVISSNRIITSKIEKK